MDSFGRKQSYQCIEGVKAGRWQIGCTNKTWDKEYAIYTKSQRV